MVKLWCGGSGDVDRAEGGGNEITIFDPANPTQDVLSWIWSNEDTGAYFYSTKNCTGIPTQVKKETTNTITPFIGTNPNAAAPQSVRITNSVDAKEVYGVYPARVPQRGPSCTDMAIINPCQPSDQNPGIRAGQLDTYGCPYTNDLATANAVLTRANDRATIPSQALSEIVNTQCYPIPLGDDGAAFGPTSAYIFHYRKSTSGLARNSTALQLDDGQRFASLSVDYLDRSKNTPAQGAKLYWSYPNPDTLITTPIPGVPITKYGEPPFYPAKPRSTYAKELQFNYRKSYTVFLKAEHPTADNLDVCVAYESSIYLPFRSVYQSGRYIYRMDVIPTYVQSFF
jgi:hypothetical protein